LAQNHLHYGDNLKVLREHVADASVDLIYLDPPFNSNRAYNVLFNRDGHADAAQMQAFDDTWHWTTETESQYGECINGGVPYDVADALGAFRTLLGENDAMAYLVNMAPRLVELRRVLKASGSLYLHCDPTMSHYLKVMLDAIFGPQNFRNEVVWQRTTSKGAASRRLPSNHDVLLAYQRSGQATWNNDSAFIAYDEADLDEKTAGKYNKRESDGRLYRLSALEGPSDPRPNLTYEVMGVTRRWRWSKERMQQAIRDGIVVQTKPGTVPQMKRYLDEMKGKPLGDVWADIFPLNSQAVERLGYPTQKPVALVERVIALASGPDDVVLDPFCGCGTTIDAAVRQERRWIGIDVTYIAVDLIRKRLLDSYGPSIAATYDVTGIPQDLLGAHALADHSKFEFERWAVSLVDGTPNERQVGDKGFDGLIRFHHSSGKGPADGKILVSVKGGKQLNPSMVQALDGALTTHKAHMGVFVSLNPVTRGMREIADRGGNYTWPSNGQHFPRIQILTVPELFQGKKVQSPPRLLPYISAVRQTPTVDQVALDI
jgi:DNA modification methylase